MPIHKQTISPGQALLILIDHYKDDLTKVNDLKKLYFQGVQSSNDQSDFDFYLTDSILNKYTVSNAKEVIDNDPSRRYFETYLAQQTIIENIEFISTAALQDQFDSLHQVVKDNWVPIEYENKILPILRGTGYDGKDKRLQEYSHHLQSIANSSMYPELDDEQREKVMLLVMNSFLAVDIAKNSALYQIPLPLNIYGEGFYHDQNRGKEFKKDQATTRNHHHGLMKGHMPVPSDDPTTAKVAPDWLKSSEQSAYIDGASWVEHSFTSQVHPFSNSISGTLLVQLRTLVKFQQENEELPRILHSEEAMTRYLQLFTSALLYGNGGHSFYELSYPVQLEKVQEAFKDIEDFDSIDMQSLYRVDNEYAFDESIEKAIAYNKQLLAKRELNQEVEVSKPSLKETKTRVQDFKTAYKQIVDSYKEAAEHGMEPGADNQHQDEPDCKIVKI